MPAELAVGAAEVRTLDRAAVRGVGEGRAGRPCRADAEVIVLILMVQIFEAEGAVSLTRTSLWTMDVHL